MTRRLFSSFAALFAPIQKSAELTPDKDLFKNGMCPVCFHQHVPPKSIWNEQPQGGFVPPPQIIGARIRIDCDICSATFAVTVIKAFEKPLNMIPQD